MHNELAYLSHAEIPARLEEIVTGWCAELDERFSTLGMVECEFGDFANFWATVTITSRAAALRVEILESSGPPQCKRWRSIIEMFAPWGGDSRAFVTDDPATLASIKAALTDYAERFFERFGMRAPLRTAA